MRQSFATDSRVEDIGCGIGVLVCTCIVELVFVINGLIVPCFCDCDGCALKGMIVLLD